MSNLTKSQLTILQSIWASPNKQSSRCNLRFASSLTHRGFGIVICRMIDAGLIAQVPYEPRITITLGGMKALGLSRDEIRASFDEVAA